MLSFWEKKYLLHADLLIAGSGITGLSAACSIKEKYPDKEIVILERGLLPTGASTKNAGFACVGSITEKQYDIRLMGEDALLQLVSDRWEGLHLLRKRLGDATIDYQNYGGYELVTTEQQVSEDELRDMNKRLFPIFGKAIYRFKNEAISTFGFKGVSQLIVNEVEGQINTGLMLKSLLQYATSLGIRIISGAEITHFEDGNDNVSVYLKGQTVPYKGDQLMICTNAFTSKLLPDEEITPGRGQVLITTPIPGLKWKGIFNFDEGFYYFRNFENRVLFGGGRNLAFEEETTTEFALNTKIQNRLETYLNEMILPDTPFEIEDRWSGIMAFGKNKLPLLKRISDRVLVGARLNGMGIALGSKIGDQLCTMAYSQGN